MSALSLPCKCRPRNCCQGRQTYSALPVTTAQEMRTSNVVQPLSHRWTPRAVTHLLALVSFTLLALPFCQNLLIGSGGDDTFFSFNTPANFRLACPNIDDAVDFISIPPDKLHLLRYTLDEQDSVLAQGAVRLDVPVHHMIMRTVARTRLLRDQWEPGICTCSFLPVLPSDLNGTSGAPTDQSGSGVPVPLADILESVMFHVALPICARDLAGCEQYISLSTLVDLLKTSPYLLWPPALEFALIRMKQAVNALLPFARIVPNNAEVDRGCRVIHAMDHLLRWTGPVSNLSVNLHTTACRIHRVELTGTNARKMLQTMLSAYLTERRPPRGYAERHMSSPSNFTIELNVDAVYPASELPARHSGFSPAVLVRVCPFGSSDLRLPPYAIPQTKFPDGEDKVSRILQLADSITEIQPLGNGSLQAFTEQAGLVLRFDEKVMQSNLLRVAIQAFSRALTSTAIFDAVSYRIGELVHHLPAFLPKEVARDAYVAMNPLIPNPLLMLPHPRLNTDYQVPERYIWQEAAEDVYHRCNEFWQNLTVMQTLSALRASRATIEGVVDGSGPPFHTKLPDCFASITHPNNPYRNLLECVLVIDMRMEPVSSPLLYTDVALFKAGCPSILETYMDKRDAPLNNTPEGDGARAIYCADVRSESLAVATLNEHAGIDNISTIKDFGLSLGAYQDYILHMVEQSYSNVGPSAVPLSIYTEAILGVSLRSHSDVLRWSTQNYSVPFNVSRPWVHVHILTDQDGISHPLVHLLAAAVGASVQVATEGTAIGVLKLSPQIFLHASEASWLAGIISAARFVHYPHLGVFSLRRDKPQSLLPADAQREKYWLFHDASRILTIDFHLAALHVLGITDPTELYARLASAVPCETKAVLDERIAGPAASRNPFGDRVKTALTFLDIIRLTSYYAQPNCYASVFPASSP